MPMKCFDDWWAVETKDRRLDFSHLYVPGPQTAQLGTCTVMVRAVLNEVSNVVRQLLWFWFQ